MYGHYDFKQMYIVNTFLCCMIFFTIYFCFVVRITTSDLLSSVYVVLFLKICLIIQKAFILYGHWYFNHFDDVNFSIFNSKVHEIKKFNQLIVSYEYQ